MIPGFSKLNYYEILDIAPGKEGREIQEGYYRVRSAFAKNALASYSLYTLEERQKILQLIEEAYHTLIDEKNREEYDRKLAEERLKIIKEGKLHLPVPPLLEVERERPEPSAASAGETALPEEESRSPETAEKKALLPPPSVSSVFPRIKAENPPDENGPPFPEIPVPPYTPPSTEPPSAQAPPPSPPPPVPGPRPQEPAGQRRATPFTPIRIPPAPPSLIPPQPEPKKLSQFITRPVASAGRPAETSGKEPADFKPRPAPEPPARGREEFEDTIMNIPPPRKPPSTPLDFLEGGVSGKFLKSAREAKGITLDRVWQTTRIRKPILVAIEEEDYKKLPADVFLKGMLLIYARFLELDHPEAVAKEYMERVIAARDWLE